MLLGEVLRVALQSIRANLFRACLTMLGIIIGVAAVITMLAAGSGAQQRIEEQLDALGANLLNITADRPFFLRGVARAQLTLEVEDVTALQEKSQYLDTVVPTLEGRNQVKYGNKNINVRVLGTTQEYPNIFNYRVATGRMFTAEEDEFCYRCVPRSSESWDPRIWRTSASAYVLAFRWKPRWSI